MIVWPGRLERRSYRDMADRAYFQLSHEYYDYAIIVLHFSYRWYSRIYELTQVWTAILRYGGVITDGSQMRRLCATRNPSDYTL